MTTDMSLLGLVLEASPIVQLVMLARRLEASGFEFWNLGHPYMDYKTKLGAEVLPRTRFLPRWDTATKGDAGRLS